MTFDLTGSLLIATPGMGDPRFVRALIYLCSHSAEGAFGLMLNRPVPGLHMGKVLEQVGIPETAALPEGLTRRCVLSGGPVESQRGFVLHDGPATGPEGQGLPGGLVLSASLDILRLIARGEGPANWLLALGYAGWGAGQLESEIAQNAWLTTASNSTLVFEPAPGERQWQGALRSMGIDPISLSAVAGHA